MKLGYFAKAIYASLGAFVGSLATVTAGQITLGQVSLSQWLVALGAALTAGGVVYGVTNASPTDE